MFLRLLWILLCMSLLNACGQSGPLYLPDPIHSPQKQGSTNA